MIFYVAFTTSAYTLILIVILVGTLQANKQGIPKEVKATAGRETNSYKVFHEKDQRDMQLHSYVVKTKSTGMRNVLLLSTKKVILGTTKVDGDKFKPAAYRYYDYTKVGVDIVDQVSQPYTTNSKSKRFTRVALTWCLDTAKVNAKAIWCLNNNKNPRKFDSFEFGWKLATQLVYPHFKRRSFAGLQKDTVAKMEVWRLSNPEEERLYPPAPNIAQQQRVPTAATGAVPRRRVAGHPQPAPAQGRQPQPAPAPRGQPQRAPAQRGQPQPAPAQRGQPQPGPSQHGQPQPGPAQPGQQQPRPTQGGQPQPDPAQHGQPQPAPRLQNPGPAQPVHQVARQRANTAPAPVRPRHHEMIPFPVAGARRHCFYCLRALPQTGFKAEKNKLSRTEKQCQSCEKALCTKHQNLICTPCSNSYQPKNQEQPREGRM